MEKLIIIGNPEKNKVYQQMIHYITKKMSLPIETEIVDCTVENFLDCIESARKDARIIEIGSALKNEAFSLSDLPTERASPCQMANVLYVCDGRIYADNTYGKSLCADLETNMGWPLKNKKILMICSNNNIYSCLIDEMKKRDVQHVFLASYSPEKIATRLKEKKQLSPLVSAGHINDIDNVFDIIINTTNVLLSKEHSLIKSILFRKGTLAYDLNYSADNKNYFLTSAEEQGAQTGNGQGFVLERARELITLFLEISGQTNKIRDVKNLFRGEKNQTMQRPTVKITEINSSQKIEKEQ